MQFYLNSTNLTEIRDMDSLGLLDGVAINATVQMEDGQTFHEHLGKFCQRVKTSISVGVLSLNEKAIVKEGRELFRISENIIVKCPLTPAGLKATKRLTAEGIKVNMSLCFCLPQALVAAKAGAWCVSLCPNIHQQPSRNDPALISSILQAFQHYGVNTRVLLTEIQEPQELLDAILAGCHMCTVRFSTIQQFFHRSNPI